MAPIDATPHLAPLSTNVELLHAPPVRRLLPVPRGEGGDARDQSHDEHLIMAA